MRRHVSAILCLLLSFITICPSIAFATTACISARLRPAEGVVASGLAVFDPGTKLGAPTRFGARVTISSSSYPKLKIQPGRPASARVTIQTGSMPVPVAMVASTTNRDGINLGFTWRIDITGPRAPIMRRGDSVTVYVNGQIALKGFAK